jgi:hypothetical protein
MYDKVLKVWVLSWAYRVRVEVARGLLCKVIFEQHLMGCAPTDNQYLTSAEPISELPTLKPNSNTLIPPSIDRIDIRNKM